MNVGGGSIWLAFAIPLTTISTDVLPTETENGLTLEWPGRLNRLSSDLAVQAFDFKLYQDGEGHDEEMMAKCVLRSQLFD